MENSAITVPDGPISIAWKHSQRFVLLSLNVPYRPQIKAACNPRGWREINLNEEFNYHQKRLEEMINKMVWIHQDFHISSDFRGRNKIPANSLPYSSITKKIRRRCLRRLNGKWK